MQFLGTQKPRVQAQFKKHLEEAGDAVDYSVALESLSAADTAKVDEIVIRHAMQSGPTETPLLSSAESRAAAQEVIAHFARNNDFSAKWNAAESATASGSPALHPSPLPQDLARAVELAKESDIRVSASSYTYRGEATTEALAEVVREDLHHGDLRDSKAIDLSGGDQGWHLDDWLDNDEELVEAFVSALANEQGALPSEARSLWLSSDDVPGASSEWANQVLLLHAPEQNRVVVLDFVYEA